jgi:hypothetical protein
MIRHLNPADIPVLIFKGRLFCNQARTKNSLDKEDTSPLTTAVFLEQWLIPNSGRCSWVYTSGMSIRSLVSARYRGGRAVWEIDHLALRNEYEESTCLDPLRKLDADGRELGVKRAFLRLPIDSPLADAVRRAGFHPYLSESLFQLQGRAVDSRVRESTSGGTLRHEERGDEYRIFELYSAAVPPSVRAIEGASFGEWQKGRERPGAKWRRTEFVCEREGDLVAWLGLATKGEVGQLEVMARRGEELEWMVEYGLTSLGDCHRTYCLVPEFQGKLAKILKNRGGKEKNKYLVLVKQLAIPVREPSLMPVGA